MQSEDTTRVSADLTHDIKARLRVLSRGNRRSMKKEVEYLIAEAVKGIEVPKGMAEPTSPVITEPRQRKAYDVLSHWEMVRAAARRGIMEITEARRIVETKCAEEGIEVPEEVTGDVDWPRGVNGGVQ